MCFDQASVLPWYVCPTHLLKGVSKNNDLQSAAIHLLLLKLTTPPGCSCQGNIYCPRQKSVLNYFDHKFGVQYSWKDPVYL